MPEHQPPARCVLLDGEQLEVLAKLAVVPSRRLLLHTLVRLELLLSLPCSAVDALQHGPLLVPTPVGTRQGLEQQPFGPDLSGVLHVGPRAQVPPAALRTRLANVVDGDGRVWLPGHDAVQDLQLVGLSHGGDAAAGLLLADLLPHKRQVLPGKPLHLLLNGLEVLVSQGVLPHIEVVVEAVLDPGPDGALRPGEQLLHRHGHQVRRAVPYPQQRIGLIARGQLHHAHLLLGFRNRGRSTHLAGGQGGPAAASPPAPDGGPQQQGGRPPGPHGMVRSRRLAAAARGQQPRARQCATLHDGRQGRTASLFPQRTLLLREFPPVRSWVQPRGIAARLERLLSQLAIRRGGL
mmetsp:Transcript_27832/g.78709  ORF Transcript_27832/g.78709 Transcript_27832/m.78709 type:complete len:349 (-) Transcript_27832:109-1155(-)